MPTVLLIAAALLWTAWAVQGVLSALQVRKFASRFGGPIRDNFRAYRPPAAVIVPFKGIEPGLADHLALLHRQNYPAYRLVLVVESEDDPAHALVLDQQRRATADRPIDVIVAGRAPANTGQKVHNQLAGIAHLQKLGAGEQVWVFADSDAAPGPHWLGDLVGPLEQHKKTAVTTGYRWLFPVGEGAPSLWSKLASVLNASVACFAGRDEFNHAWGGSMAMTVATANAGDLVGHLRGALSDDYQVTALARSLGMRIYFVPSCLVRSPVSLDRPSFANFVHRQYLITRLHAPAVFYPATAVMWLYTLGMVTAWASLILGLILAPRSFWTLGPALALAVMIVANQCRGGYRRRAIRRAFGEPALVELRGALRMDRFGAWLWMPMHALVMTRAAVGRTLSWRGHRYRIHSPQHIERLD